MNAQMQALQESLQQVEQAHQQRLQQLEQRCEQAEARYQQSERRYHHAERRFRVLGGLALVAVIGAILVSPSNRAALAQGYGETLKDLIKRVKALEDKLASVTVVPSPDAPGCQEVRFTGVNVRIVNGMGTTNTTNGCGNLIVGYNALRFGGTDERTGSHNLILGDENNYTFYGGLVAGESNNIVAPYASVSGGHLNTAGGEDSSVSGGQNNTASKFASSVSGGGSNIPGQGNTAGGESSSVSGGQNNTASGTASSVSGGGGNKASSLRSSVSGGIFNKARGEDSSVSGGQGIAQIFPIGWSAGSFGKKVSGNFHSP